MKVKTELKKMQLEANNEKRSLDHELSSLKHQLANKLWVSIRTDVQTNKFSGMVVQLIQETCIIICLYLISYCRVHLVFALSSLTSQEH